MTVSQRVLVSLVMMFALVLVAAPARAADVDGKWTGSLDTPMGAIPISFSFRADGATLNGSMAMMEGTETPFKGGKVEGDKISFVASFDFGGMAIELNFTGVVGKESVALIMEVMGMQIPITVTKTKPQ